MFHEAERLDATFTQFGEVAVPNQSGHIHLVTIRDGQHRLITISRPMITGEMYGIIATLLAGRGSLLTPVAAPIAFLPIRRVAAPTFGRFVPGDAGYDAYRGALRRITDEPFALFIAQVALTAVLPIWIAPLFYRLTPLADERLGERLLTLARRAGVEAVGVFVADQSRKSRTANAAVVGLGRTRRIVLFDTLTARFTPEEIESVLAHELGHHVHGDARRGLAVQGALMLASLWLADTLLRAGAPALGLAGPADPAGMPWLALVLLVLSLAALPLGNGFSRRIERQADDFALAVTGNPGAFIAAMERLGELNLAERRPSRLKELVLYSHPALERRIARARGGLA